MKRTIAGIALATAVGTFVACTPSTDGGPGQPTNATNANVASGGTNTNGSAAPAPATFEKGSPQYIATHQPDYTADVTVQAGPTKLVGKVAKLGDAYRYESSVPPIGKTITYIRPGQPTIMILVDKKQYVEYTDGAEVNPLARTIQGITQPGVKFEKIGTETVDNHPTQKFRGTKDGETGEIVLYAASDLNDMIIKIDGKKENVTFSAVWSNIATSVPSDAVQPPADLTTAYKKVEVGEFGAMFSEGGGAADPTAGGAAPATPPSGK